MKLYAIFRIVHNQGEMIASTKCLDLARRIVKVEKEKDKGVDFNYIILQTDYNPLLNGPFYHSC